ncbi:MAG: Rrf2 family transcriptional regulator [Ruminococcus sp.]|nr:Rrf2 family transcriptional regulator [Ruminococcus sp.]
MKISCKVEFGVIALADIAIYSEGGGTVSSGEISQRQNISQKYLEQILVALRQAGFIRGQKGSRGGYSLARRAESIYFTDILNALDNTILADSYTPGEDIEELRDLVNGCVWEKLNRLLRGFADTMTLADLVEKYKTESGSGGEYMYYI